MLDVFPQSVRYVKNGAHGNWWAAAKAAGQIHLGWSVVPHDVMRSGDFDRMKALIEETFHGRPGATADFNALRSLLDHPSQHLWITFQDGCMWWCTVQDGFEANPNGISRDRGHFWLVCDRPWSNASLGGRSLAIADLPGVVTRVSGFKGTVCEPKHWQEILRIVRGEENPVIEAAEEARRTYESKIAELVTQLHQNDFELLVELILSRAGWVRRAKLGGTTEGIDVEVENAVANEIAFVQVKSESTQKVLEDYIARFNSRRGHYARMIFVVHSSGSPLLPPAGQPIQVWEKNKIAALVVRVGLGDWIAARF